MRKDELFTKICNKLEQQLSYAESKDMTEEIMELIEEAVLQDQFPQVKMFMKSLNEQKEN